MGFFSELFGLYSTKEHSGASTYSEKDFLLHGDMLSSLDKNAKIAYDSYFSGIIETFNSVSNRIIHDIVDECKIINCNQPYLNMKMTLANIHFFQNLMQSSNRN